jgi:hypothetical protein
VNAGGGSVRGKDENRTLEGTLGPLANNPGWTIRRGDDYERRQSLTPEFGHVSPFTFNPKTPCLGSHRARHLAAAPHRLAAEE